MNGIHYRFSIPRAWEAGLDPLRDPFFTVILPGIKRFWQLNDSSFEMTNCKRFRSVQLLNQRINAPFDTLPSAGQVLRASSSTSCILQDTPRRTLRHPAYCRTPHAAPFDRLRVRLWANVLPCMNSEQAGTALGGRMQREIASLR